MSIALFSLFNMTLFMIHEFDEIVLIKPWIESQKDNLAYQQEMFIKGRKVYPSTESTALLIGEEFLLASIISLVASYFNSPELSIALLTGHLLHLLGHIGEWLRYRRFVPGAFTALVTFPILLIWLVYFVLATPLKWLLLLVLIPLVFILILANLYWLHSKSHAVENWLKKFVS